jgi:outer membrane protein OmpA-like peptidoglycan-associated protein
MNKFLLAIYLTLALILSDITANAQFVTDKAIDSTSNAEIEEQVMAITVRDAASKLPIHCDIVIKGLNPRKPVTIPNVQDTLIAFKSYRLYTISAIKPGYMYFAHKFWPQEKDTHEENIQMKPLAIGLKTSIEDITFLGDQTDIYHKSAPALEELIEFMMLNPQVKIRIIGHANGPESEKKGALYYKKASEKRAEAVRDYMIQHKIAPERLATKGAGNTEMLFPDPQTDWETQANRRIEIEVIGL